MSAPSSSPDSIPAPQKFSGPEDAMHFALELAARGLGHVEPNPPVGAVVVEHDGTLISFGYHQKFGGPHAELLAIRSAGDRCRGNSLFLTLEPCSDFPEKKTPPCTPAVMAAGFKTVHIAVPDPHPACSGMGIRALRDAGIDVQVGTLAPQAQALIAPFTKLVRHKLPFVHAKWAMSLDGKIATRTGDSRWISNEISRARVHELRGRMDAIIVGIGTALADDPLLTARPPGPRTPLRIVLDSSARLPLDSQLVRTAREVPLLLAVSTAAPAPNLVALRNRGVELLELPTTPAPHNSQIDLQALLPELGRRNMTNVLVEGGSKLLGAFFDNRLIDYWHVFVAPKIIGGSAAPSPLAGEGIDLLVSAQLLDNPSCERLGGDLYLHGPLTS